MQCADSVSHDSHGMRKVALLCYQNAFNSVLIPMKMGNNCLERSSDISDPVPRVEGITVSKMICQESQKFALNVFKNMATM